MTGKIKIAFVIPTLDRDEGGGILEFLYLLVKYIDVEYFQAEIFAFYSSPVDCVRFEETGATVYIASSKKEENSYLSLVNWLTLKFKETRPQIVHTNIYWADTIGRQVAIRCKIPVIISTEHNTNVNESLEQRQIKKRLSSATDVIVCNTESVRDYSIGVDGIDSMKLEVIPCGFNLDCYARGIGDVPTLSKRFYFVGRLVEQKQPLELITAFADIIKKIPDCRLHCVGDGPLYHDCINLVKALGMEKAIYIEGYKSNPYEFVEPGSLFVLNSHYEGQGIVLLEAMAQGMVCLAPACGGIQDVITHGINGFLFRTNNPSSLKSLIQHVLAMEIEKVNQIRRNAYVEVVETYSPKKMAMEYSAVYTRCLSKNSGFRASKALGKI